MLIFCRVNQRVQAVMAKVVRGRTPKTAKPKAPVTAKRKAAGVPLTSAAKFKALVDNLTTTELDELIKAATARKRNATAKSGARKGSRRTARGK